MAVMRFVQQKISKYFTKNYNSTKLRNFEGCDCRCIIDHSIQIKSQLIIFFIPVDAVYSCYLADRSLLKLNVPNDVDA